MIFLRSRLFPELKQFRGAAEQRNAWRRAQSETQRRPWFWICLALILIADAALVFSLPYLAVPVTKRGLVRGAALLLTVLAAATLSWIFQKAIRRSLRQQLSEKGVPICISCGYNLTGHFADRCPECGAEKPQ